MKPMPMPSAMEKLSGMTNGRGDARNRLQGVVPLEVSEAACHQAGHEEQRCGRGKLRHAFRQRCQPKAGQEERRHDHCRQAGSSAAFDAGGALYVAGGGRGADKAAEHRCRGVGQKRSPKPGQPALGIDQAAASTHGHPTCRGCRTRPRAAWPGQWSWQSGSRLPICRVQAAPVRGRAAGTQRRETRLAPSARRLPPPPVCRSPAPPEPAARTARRSGRSQ